MNECSTINIVLSYKCIISSTQFCIWCGLPLKWDSEAYACCEIHILFKVRPIPYGICCEKYTVYIVYTKYLTSSINFIFKNWSKQILNLKLSIKNTKKMSFELKVNDINKLLSEVNFLYIFFKFHQFFFFNLQED